MSEGGEARNHEAIARAFHEAYERLAPEYGYKTREATEPVTELKQE